MELSSLKLETFLVNRNPEEEERDTETHSGEGRRCDSGADGEPQVRPLHREGGRDDQPVGRQQGLG